MAPKLIKITDDTLYFECTCGEKLTCPSNNFVEECSKCYETVDVGEEKKVFLYGKKHENKYFSIMQTTKDRVKDKFNLKYGDVGALTKRLKTKKRG